MNTLARLGLTVTSAAALIGALAGCAAGAAAPASTTPASTATTASPVPTRTPATTASPTAQATATPGPTSGAAPLAQHVFDECSTGAAENGVTLTFTADPSGQSGPGGDFQVVYPFTFDDGHTDPYAIYTCTLTDDTVTSSYVGGGLSDTR